MKDVANLLTDVEAGIQVLTTSLEEAQKLNRISKQHVQIATIAAINEFLSKAGIEPHLRAPLVSIASDIAKHVEADSRKPLDESIKGASAAAAVHVLMLGGDSMQDAGAAISRATGGALTAKQLIELRKNISKGRARSEAKDYYDQLIHQWTSPESLTSALDHAGKRKSLLIMVSEIFAVPHKG